jgi:hypothetical protein
MLMVARAALGATSGVQMATSRSLLIFRYGAAAVYVVESLQGLAADRCGSRDSGDALR